MWHGEVHNLLGMVGMTVDDDNEVVLENIPIQTTAK